MAFYSSGREQAGSEFHLHDRKSGVVKIFSYTCTVADFEVDPGVVERTCLPATEEFGRAVDVDVAVDPRLDQTHATVDGVTVPGELVACSMSRVRQAEVRVYHGLPN